MSDAPSRQIDAAPSISEVIAGGLGEEAAVSGASHVIRVSADGGKAYLFLLSTPEYREWLRRKPGAAPARGPRFDAFGPVRPGGRQGNGRAERSH